MSEKLESLKKRFKAKHNVVDNIDELIKHVGREGPVGASLNRQKGGNQYVIVAVGEDGSTGWLVGEDSYDDDLNTLVRETKNLSLNVADMGNWPPCEDPIWCEPDIAARVQHLISPLAGRLRPRTKTRA